MAVFGRFLDTWVVDRVMFEFVNQGGCNCCGFSHGGMGMQDFMALCSDVETDDGKKERTSPWPAFMQDEVWSDRVKFRRMLKQTMNVYRERFEAHGGAFVSWWLSLPAAERKRCFQMPREELRVQFSTTFDFKTAYQVVLCSVLEQVEKFEMTGYTHDGGTDCEVFMEEQLLAKRGAWTVREPVYATDEGCDMFFGMLLQLGGDHLMPKRSVELRKQARDAKRAAEVGPAGAKAAADKSGDKAEGGEDDDGEREDEAAGDDDEGGGAGDGQSFRSDRRLVRILILRYFADMAWAKFKRAELDNNQAAAAGDTSASADAAADAAADANVDTKVDDSA